MPRSVREQIVLSLDKAILLLQPLNKKQRRATIAAAAAGGIMPSSPKEIGKQIEAILKTIRVGLRVRTRQAVKGPRPTSVFNLFVRETMCDMKANGIVFKSTTERMKECGRLWKLRKEENAAAAAAAAGIATDGK